MLYTVCLLLAAASTDSGAAAVPAYTIQTVAGGVPGTASPTAIRQAEGVLLSAGGNIYFSDAVAHLVRRIDTSGNMSIVAGTGAAGFSGDGGPATAAELNQPYGLAADAGGNLYIADLGNARIRVVAPDGTISTFAGGGQAAAALGWNTATSVKLEQPRNVAAGFDGSIYVSDFAAHQVYRVAQHMLSLFAGAGVQGNTGDSGPAIQATLAFPAGLAVDLNGTVYIADSGNNAIRKIENGIITTAATLKRPTGVAVDFYRNIYVAGADTVGKLGAESLLAGVGANDIAADLLGNTAFVTKTAVERANISGNLTLIAGAAGSSTGTTGGGSMPAALVQPCGLAIDSAGNVYIADAKANVVWSLSTSGTLAAAFGNGDAKTMSAPASVAVDPFGHIYIADTGNNRVLTAGADGNLTVFLDQLNAPAYVFADANGVLVADTGNNRVLVVSTAGSVSSIIPVDAAAAAIRDENGNIYVSQRDAGQVVRFASNGWTTPLLLDAKTPAGLALDTTGDLLLADAGHNGIRLIAPDGSYTTIAGTGSAGYTGDGGPALSALLNAPADVKLDAKGQIWVADSINGAVRVLTSSGQAVHPPPGYGGGPFRVVSSATFQAGAIAPEEIVSIFGSGFDPENTQVTFDGAPAFLFYTGSEQINALAPVTLAVGSSTSVSVVVNGMSQGSVRVDVAASAPGLFTFGSGVGQAAALNQDTSVNGADNPAAAGSIIVLYATGDGAGKVGVEIGGRPADILYGGDAPGYVGLMQINARIPKGMASGAAPVSLTIGDAASQDGVTIQVK